MELCVQRVSDYLTSKGVDSTTVSIIEDNGIDGEALKELVNDFYEFSSLVTAPLARLKIKKAVKGFLSTQEELEAIADGDGDDQVAQDESNGDFTDVLPLEKHLDLETSMEVSKDEDIPPPEKHPHISDEEPKSASSNFDTKNFSLPTHFSRKVTAAIADNTLGEPDNRAAFVREHTFNKQLTQRYRNNRRKSSTAKCPKLVLPSSSTSSVQTSPTTTTDEEQENVDALCKLSGAKNPPAQTVQELLDVTRTERKHWLKTPNISIENIFKKYPILQNPKWLLYEFKKLLEEDIMSIMSSNWDSACKKIKADISDQPDFRSEKLILDVITKNIYHKKPTKLPFTFVEASGDIESHFSSELVEPRLVIFHDEEKIVQVFLAAEGEALMELPSTTVLEGIVYLMAAYYVLDIQYPKVCKPMLFFFQDILMDKPDSLPRPVRYSAYVKSVGF